MTKVNLTPSTTGTLVGTPTVTGAGGDLDAALADSSDATYVTLNAGEKFTVGLSDLTLPTDAVILYAQSRVRCAKTGYYVYMTTVLDVASEQVAVTWNTAAVAQAPTIISPTDAQLDAANASVENPTGSPADLIVYQLVVEVLYIIKPVVTVAYPAEGGTLTEDNTPDVLWIVAYDPDKSSPPELDYEIKIYDDTTFTLGSVDPDVDTPYLEASGTLPFASFYGHNFSEILPNDNYKVFVRTSYADGQWSDWDANTFTVNTPLPGEPTVEVLPEDNLGRLRVEVTDVPNATATDYFELQRSLDGGATWEFVRTTAGNGKLVDEDADGFVYYWDIEVPNGVDATYRARAVHEYTGGLGISDWGATDFDKWESDDAWIKSVFDPFNNTLPVIVRKYSNEEEPANMGVFRPLGATNPTIVDDVRGPLSGSITVRCDSREDREDLRRILTSPGPFLIQVPLSWEIPDRWVKFGNRSGARLIDSAKLPHSDEELEWIVVDEPTDNRVED